jgi:hypothetical protein
MSLKARMALTMSEMSEVQYRLITFQTIETELKGLSNTT